MRYKHLILAFTTMITACHSLDESPYEKQPPLDYNMNCEQIVKALDEAKARLERTKERRETVTDKDIAVFLASLGQPRTDGLLAEKAAEAISSLPNPVVSVQEIILISSISC